MKPGLQGMQDRFFVEDLNRDERVIKQVRPEIPELNGCLFWHSVHSAAVATE